MVTIYSEVPQALSIKYEGLKKGSAFKIHPKGYQLFVSLFSGQLDGEEVTVKQIASRLDITPTAVHKIKRRVMASLEVDWSKYDLNALDRHFTALKEVAAGLPEVIYRELEGADGSKELVEVDMSPTKWIATQHRTIYKDALTMMAELKEETKNAAWVSGGRRYFDSRAYTTYALFMDKVRAYGKDWLDLFGRLEESAITDAILKRKGIMENTMDFFSDHMGETITPALILTYMELLRA